MNASRDQCLVVDFDDDLTSNVGQQAKRIVELSTMINMIQNGFKGAGGAVLSGESTACFETSVLGNSFMDFRVSYALRVGR